MFTSVRKKGRDKRLLGVSPVLKALPACELSGESERVEKSGSFSSSACCVLSTESLISAIQGDIEEAKKRLDLPEHLKLKEDNFFRVPKSKIMNGHWWKIILLLFIHSLCSSILLLITPQLLYFKNQTFSYSCELNSTMYLPRYASTVHIQRIML